jgi:hypothetical protein
MKKHSCLLFPVSVIALIILGFLSVALNAQSCSPVLLAGGKAFVLQAQVPKIEFKNGVFVATFDGKKSPLALTPPLSLMTQGNCDEPILARLVVKRNTRQIYVKMVSGKKIIHLLPLDKVSGFTPHKPLSKGEYIFNIGDYDYPFRIVNN